MLDDVSVREKSRKSESDRVKEERDRSLEEVNASTMLKEKLEKTMLEKEVAMKAMTRSVVNLE